MMSYIEKNLNDISVRIAFAAEKAGRKQEDVRLLAVSKTFSADDIKKAFACGQLCFGENKVQELELKVPVLPEQIEWHLIGHLQSNKVAKAVKLASWIHSVDSEKLILKLDKLAEENAKKVKILLEVNTSGEESKSGIRGDDECMRLAELMMKSNHLQFQGLMTMASQNADERQIRNSFSKQRQLKERIEKTFQIVLPDLSMGMSHDFEYAIMEGSTIVRVGTAIFGRREYL